jgi:galactokinase
MTTFLEVFGRPAQAEGRAPGRVNLLGEHTDYNQGLVLPLAIPREVHTSLARSEDDRHRFRSLQLGTIVDFADGEEAPPGFGRYVWGCVQVARGHGHAIPPLSVLIDSQVPIGAGLSSSAALEVSVLRALRQGFDLPIDDVTLAGWAHEAEVQYAGVRCGILDQMAASLASADQMLFLDTRSLERRLLPLPEGASLCIIDSGTSRALAGSGYNQRRAECEAAARLLGVASLRDVDDLACLSRLPGPLDRRARHVISENARVRMAIAGADARAFGALMNASHESLSKDYEVSTPALDALASLFRTHPAAFGAKLTGTGFGGACVALVQARRSGDVAEEVLARSRAAGIDSRLLLVT